MDLTATVSRHFSVPILDVMESETDDVVMLVNYLIEFGNDNNQSKLKRKNNGTVNRVRVNDTTASGGWF